MKKCVICCLILVFICSFHVFAFTSQMFRRHGGFSLSSHFNYDTFYLDQKIDHFGFQEDGTFKQRYLVADKHWRQPGGPILFYTGNEGDISWFCNNTGFMWDVAEEMQAMLVFAEHRYYGQSMPFGPDSYRDSKHLNYLTSEQALADFAVLIQNLKSSRPGAQHSPVIAIGGSYGGMLAAWLRMKYPHVVVGALASSAPIWQFSGMVPCGNFYSIVTQDFAQSGPNCHTNIRASWKAMDRIFSTAWGPQWLSEELSLCAPLKSQKDLADLKSWLQETWVNLAMVDYPYKADFLQPLPPWPIQAVCKHLRLDPTASDQQLLHAVSQAAKVYYNSTGSSPCLNTSQTATGSLGELGWNYQACTEMVMPMCADGVQDMFQAEEWDFQAFSDECHATFGVRPRADWAASVYGGKDIASHSNIIFSNGGLDPWSSGGVTFNVSDSLVSIMIPEGAHHLDLRHANHLDPPSVCTARVLELGYFWRWIQEAKAHPPLAPESLSKDQSSGSASLSALKLCRQHGGPFQFPGRSTSCQDSPPRPGQSPAGSLLALAGSSIQHLFQSNGLFMILLRGCEVHFNESVQQRLFSARRREKGGYLDPVGLFVRGSP